MAKAQRLLFAKDDPADDPRNRGDDVMPPDLLAPFTSGAEKRSSTTRFRALVVILVAASVVATLLGGETVQTFLVPVFRNNGSGGSKLSKLGTAENVRRKPHPQLATMNDAMQERLVREANKFVLSRRRKYEETGRGVNWKFRGVGYMYTKLQMVLAARVFAIENGVDKSTHSVHIFNVFSPRNEQALRNETTSLHSQVEQDVGRKRNDCHKLTIWVRVYGPEIFAGAAKAVPATDSADCFWAFDFAATVPGSYSLDIKALLWNAKGKQYESEQSCLMLGEQPVDKEGGDGGQPENVFEAVFPNHYGFKGFKLYFPTMMCCEICTRLRPHCEAWSAPPIKLKEPTRDNMGCELYYRRGTPEEEIPRSWILGDINVTGGHSSNRHLAWIVENQTIEATASLPNVKKELTFGRPHDAEMQYFLGCGWSYWQNLEFPCLSKELDDKVFVRDETFDVMPLPSPSAPHRLPICGRDAELLSNSAGRWVQESFPDDVECFVPFAADKTFSAGYIVLRYNGTRPHCWHREAIDKIAAKVVGRTWNSRARVSRWMGVWRDYSCDYLEFTDEELQQCFEKRKISRINVTGRSVAGFLSFMVKQRIAPLRMYRKKDPDSVEVTLTTLALLHLVGDSDVAIRKAFREMKNATDKHDVYVYNGYFTSSERAPFTHADRMHDLNRIIEEELIPKGYVPLNMFNLSAAWSFDADLQRDGMHVVGPAMRMGVTKFFHHLCGDVVVGTRV